MLKIAVVETFEDGTGKPLVPVRLDLGVDRGFRVRRSSELVKPGPVEVELANGGITPPVPVLKNMEVLLDVADETTPPVDRTIGVAVVVLFPNGGGP